MSPQAEANESKPWLRTTGIQPGEVTAFFTDATLCIGCKACEVACKEWNELEADGMDFSGFSYDNTLAWATPPGGM